MVVSSEDAGDPSVVGGCNSSFCWPGIWQDRTDISIHQCHSTWMQLQTYLKRTQREKLNLYLSLPDSLSPQPAKTRLDIDWNSGVSSPGLAGHHYWAERLLYIDCNDPTRPHQTPADLTWLQCSVQAWGPRLMWWLRPAVTSAPSLALWDLNNSLKHKAWWEVQGRQDLSCLSFIQIHSNYVRRSRYASCQDVDLTQ